MRHFAMPSLVDLEQQAFRNGLNLFGLIKATSFDRCQPLDKRASRLRKGCGTIVVLGTAGRSFWFEFARQRSRDAAELSQQDADAWAIAGAQDVAKYLAELGLASTLLKATEPLLNFQKLGEAAGLGIVSPVSGLLLHPEYGPWLRIRAVLLVDGAPFGHTPATNIADSFQPCSVCHKPCVSACPSNVHDGYGHTDSESCLDHLEQGGCASGCHSRMACPVGAQHADLGGESLHGHAIAQRRAKQTFGLASLRKLMRQLRSEL
jgi:epoxyqueuosine reductase